ncbi:TonB-dependent receptor [Rhodanobacter sp. Soil772]|uniref:TonB-dependent receptor n=1 Tax=Rhodanobacter sp. Soil772 TaxID=1736406 RepID=UPI0006FE7827|nr:TonB-dependent receptor [Rhodanobacter sp. Soil772]KRE83573.1 TonB-dependent receptor [Rhodanobacter sp. Soil772]
MSMRQRPLSISLRRLLFGGSALLLLGSPLLAFGADAPPQDAADATKPATAAKDVTQLGKITVTAQSRSQEMQEVPIPLQIVTARQVDTLAATDLSKMSLFVPGLVVGGDQPTQPNYQLRGISTDDFGIGTESAVGVYIDGVYAARSGGALLAFNDIQRIEVLKGPQGTLFGRNAAAGAISIVTNEPSDRFEAKARLRFGNYGKRYGDALVNIPLNRDMALRVSVLDNQSSGWVKDAATGRHYGKDNDWGTRAAWRWNVAPDTRVLLSWDHEKLKQPPHPAFGLIAQSDYVLRPGTTDTLVPPFPANPANYLNPLHAPLYNDAVGAAETRRFDGATLSVDHSFSWGSLTSTTAWRNFDTLNRGDYDGTSNINTYLDTANIEHNNSWYQEFKLSGNTDLVDWVAGASWYNEQARQTSQTNVYTDSIDTLALNLGVPTGTPTGTIYGYFDSLLRAFDLPYRLLDDPWREAISNDGHFKAYAAYGDVIWHLTDRLNLTTGIRYTRDQKTFSWYNAPRYAPELDRTLDQLDQAGLLDFAAALAGTTKDALRQSLSTNLIFTDAVGTPVAFHDTWNDLSPRAVLDYKFTPDTMGYVSVTKGYKAGGYNSVQIGSRFAPEKVINYEAGIKTLLPQQNLLLNASVYHYVYNNRQSLTLDPNSAGSGVPRYLVNSSDQQASGAEVELQWQPSDAFQLGLNGAYIDATYRQATAASGVQLDGQPTGEPKYSFAATLAYTWHDVANGKLEFDLNHAYRGRSRCNRDSQLQGTCQISPNFDTGTAQQRTDARLDWSSADDHWGIALFASNVFDKRYVTGVNNISTSVFGTPYASISPPRMVSVELRAKF